MMRGDEYMTFRATRAKIGLYLAQARVALAEAVPVLTEYEQATLTDQHREEMDALQSLHARCIEACRMMSR